MRTSKRTIQGEEKDSQRRYKYRRLWLYPQDFEHEEIHPIANNERE